ncbi:CRISPR-associated helicase Cas3' [Prosthecomicrobium sp. N25]|uniref:CRISPR-associated helicase Cas3' n=1 Tax=Prosthecomicrobium sp. N25 TaxID=3129254 RepID=UPI003078164E
MFYAHSLAGKLHEDWQPLHVHLAGVADRAARGAAPFGAEKAAALAAWLHDLGKYSRAFQARLDGSVERVDHSTAGARVAIGHTDTSGLASGDRLVLELIAYAVAGHHAGLPDKTDRDGGTASLAFRLRDARIDTLDPVWRDTVPLDASDLMPAGFRFVKDPRQGSRQLAFLGRMIFSCLVDADFRDTEAFYAANEGVAPDRDWPGLPDILERLRATFDAHMAGLAATASDGPVNRLRADILAHVRGNAGLPKGVFTLDVPTGGGKTLASLAFALDHAAHHGQRRIITAIPFTSIIDQTAAIYRGIFGENIVLEHHSAIEPAQASESDEPQGRNKLRLAMEDWAAPVVVTTNVQLFESLHANRVSRCRKLHNIAGSIIILDEAQTIPLHVLRPAVDVLQELCRNYGCSVVLCTATQPALRAPDFVGGFDLTPDRELAPDPPALHRALRRTTIRMAGRMEDADLLDALAEAAQGLVIVNSRAHALALYRAGRDAGIQDLVHLTTRQIALDRRTILAAVRRRLADGIPCRLIATSLVEAGVDLDFERVWRAVAGLEQIAQAAGRCNREGRRPTEASLVTVFEPAEAKAPRELAALAEATMRVARDHPDLLSPAAIERYFREIYWAKGDGLDRDKVLGAFRISAPVPGIGATDFAYRTVAETFRLVESGMLPVIVPIDAEARSFVHRLKAGQLPPGAAARALQTRIVQVPPKARDVLIRNQHVRFVDGFADQFAVLVEPSLYTAECGLLWEEAEYLAADDMII